MPSLRFYEEKVPFNAPRPRVCAGARFLPVSFAIPKEDRVGGSTQQPVSSSHWSILPALS